MGKSITVLQKKKGRGRPATGHDPLTAVRMPKELRMAIDEWAGRQDDQPNYSQAIRRLLRSHPELKRYLPDK